MSSSNNDTKVTVIDKIRIFNIYELNRFFLFFRIFVIDRSECLCAEARARLSAWTVDDVCDFVSSIDICAEYAPVSSHH